MILKKYLDEFSYKLVVDSYDEEYLDTLDENNFIKIYELFKKYNFYFVNDIILKYLEIFQMDENYVENELLKLKNKLGINYIYVIGNDMTHLNDIIVNQELIEG